MSQVALGSFHSVVLAGSRTQSVYTWGCLETKPSWIFSSSSSQVFFVFGTWKYAHSSSFADFRENLQVGTCFCQAVNLLFLAKVMAKPWATRWVVASPCLLWWFRWKTPRLRQGPKAVREISMQSLVAC